MSRIHLMPNKKRCPTRRTTPSQTNKQQKTNQVTNIGNFCAMGVSYLFHGLMCKVFDKQALVMEFNKK